jgi:hypothetical protein
MDIAFKVLVVSTVIAVTGFFFLAITGRTINKSKRITREVIK